MPFQIVRNDITKIKADAIVNTANPKPRCGAGTDVAVYNAAGKDKLLAERKKIGNIAPGEVAVTPAFDLPAKYIIHAVGPVWYDGKQGEFDILANCYRNSLEKALEFKCKSIAFPLIATGVYGFPKDKALSTALSVIQPFILGNDIKVILVVFDKKSFVLSGKVFENIREYVDANYVKNAKEEEYGFDFDEDEELSHKEKVRRERDHIASLRNSVSLYEKSKKLKEEDLSHLTTKKKIETLLAASDKTFQEKLFEIIDERGLTGPQVYHNYVSKQVYSKIQSDKDYHPNKFTAIALCLSLHLNLEQTQDLLSRAGWTLSPSNKADIVVQGCIISKEYNLMKVNLALFDNDCPELQKIK